MQIPSGVGSGRGVRETVRAAQGMSSGGGVTMLDWILIRTDDSGRFLGDMPKDDHT